MGSRKNRVHPKGEQQPSSNLLRRPSAGLRKVRKGPAYLAGIMILVGLVITVQGLFDYKSAANSRLWPSTTGTVVRSWMLEQSYGRENKTEIRYFPKIEYHYFVFGERYLSDRIAFGGVSGGTLQSARKVVDQYPKGTDVTVYYDPNTPSSALLRAGYGSYARAKSVGGVLFCALGALVYRTWTRKRMRQER